MKTGNASSRSLQSNTGRINWSATISFVSARLALVTLVLLALVALQVGIFVNDAPTALAEKAMAPTNMSVDFKQCADKNPTAGDCDWINSILQKNNSRYTEGRGVPQRLIFDGIAPTAGNVHTITFQVLWTKGGVHAYDWLMSYNQAIATASDYGRPFNDLMGQQCGLANSLQSVCTSLVSGTNFVDVIVPDDPYISKDGATQSKINAFEATYGNRTIRIWGSSSIANASLALSHDVGNGGDTGDSYVLYTLQWTSPATQTVIEMAGHLAVTSFTTTNPIAWGVPLGSANINGGPYHFKLNSFDNGAIGNQDNQIAGADIVGPPLVTTQHSLPTFRGVPIRDTVNLTGTQGQGAVSGIVQFYICADNYAPYTDTIQPAGGCTINATSNPPTLTVTHLTPDVAVTTSGNNPPLGTATSVPFTPTLNGYYCFTAVYSSTTTSYLNFTDQIDSPTECFFINDPTAVTLTDLTAHRGTDWLPFAMGAAGILLLGTLAIIFSRRQA